MVKQNLGMVTAYAYAVVGGYDGTEAEFEALLGNIATDLAEIENLTVIANTLPSGSSATASYDHGVLTLGIPKGDKGDTGAGATVTVGTTATGNPGTNASVINSGTTKDAVFNFTIPRGDTGNGIESIELTDTQGAVKTYTILFTGGNTTTFDVTDGEVTNAQLTAAVTDLKEDIEDRTALFDVRLSANLFDVESATEGIGIAADGTEIIEASYSVSDYIPVSEGDVIKSYYVSSNVVYAANMSKVACYNSSKIIVPSAGTNSSTNTFTIPNGIAFIRVTHYASMSSTFMLIANSIAPNAYIAYSKVYIASVSFVEPALESLVVPMGLVEKQETDFWDRSLSANLFNKNDVVSGEYFETDGSTHATSNVFRSYVELNGSGTYSLKIMGDFYGLTNAVKLPTFDADKNFVKTVTGSTEDTTPSSANLMTLTISNQDIEDGVVYLGYSENPSNIDSLMVVKSATYPDAYIAYKETWTLPDLTIDADKNPLYGKIAVFDGDSICAGLNSAMGDYGNGYASRIGVDNSMEYYNVGESGACITAETYFGGGSPRHWVSRYIDTIYANYPDADYVIGEGGTNDADNFYGDAEKLGTFSETDFTGPFDDTTFYGAMDSWCKKALTYFPKAKIGFIVAQKMGTGFVTYVKNRYDYFGYASKVCKKWGVPVLNLWDDGQLRPDVVSMYDPNYNTIETATAQGLPYYDGQHLTAYGYDVISPKIEAWMKTL